MDPELGGRVIESISTLKSRLSIPGDYQDQSESTSITRRSKPIFIAHDYNPDISTRKPLESNIDRIRLNMILSSKRA